MMRGALLALLALGCAGGSTTELTAGVPASSGAPAPVAVWLSADHPAAAAQARWGLPIPCSGFQVLELPIAELQPVCNSAAELAARSATTQTLGCVRPRACELDIAAELTPAQRALVLTHEMGHLLDPRGVDHHVQDGCPADGSPGAHLMCAGGPASGAPDPTPEDFDLVLGLGVQQ